MTAWEYMIKLNKRCHFMSRERSGMASNSELKRWLKNKAVKFNGSPLPFDAEVKFPINSLTIFTKNKKVTIL